ncbi:HEAT repeat domain-containing protein [Fusobacterium canifelinum]|uniref:HEAT repeat domain-containing protein n=1 Tax=Fusobacterium canifelinum TaxID=285729 RepID=A0ABX7CDQ9_9FUSO|nr:HEAT repeat domain-containing protein [Fusobacterium canifelinum]QQS87574.1 HEAT repeat domain-containing protein [Fusobacterium canifelinum]
MSNSTDKILQELEEERIRCATLTKEDLQKAYCELEKENFPVTKRIKFIADLGACKEIAYHYELICKDWEEDRKLHLESSFDRHGSEGIEFLFEQLAKIEDEKLRIFTVFLIAEILSKLKHREFYSSFCNQLIPIRISLIKTNDNILRRKVIIVFGWVGSSKEIDLLIQQMLNDNDALCRAWSATSLMQMSFHRVKAEIICQKTKNIFVQAIVEEKDLYTCGVMIEVAQTLFGKRWISSSAIENIELEKIEKARKSAVRFLSKY